MRLNPQLRNVIVFEHDIALDPKAEAFFQRSRLHYERTVLSGHRTVAVTLPFNTRHLINVHDHIAIMRDMPGLDLPNDETPGIVALAKVKYIYDEGYVLESTRGLLGLKLLYASCIPIVSINTLRELDSGGPWDLGNQSYQFPNALNPLWSQWLNRAFERVQASRNPEIPAMRPQLERDPHSDELMVRQNSTFAYAQSRLYRNALDEDAGFTEAVMQARQVLGLPLCCDECGTSEFWLLSAVPLSGQSYLRIDNTRLLCLNHARAMQLSQALPPAPRVLQPSSSQDPLSRETI